MQVRVMGVSEEGKAIPMEDTLEWVKFSSLAWTHDNKGFFYNAYPEPNLGGSKVCLSLWLFFSLLLFADTRSSLCFALAGRDSNEPPWIAEMYGYR